ncbi:hypothetical protein [Aeromicrobium sp.]|uniref:hypothetical protein n=1 Tax=Aeromicrobium sp. TaxID=1871063 RepID=UPI002FC8EA65
MTTDPEQMWRRFADEHGLDVNDAGRPFFVDGVMVGRTPADDAGEVTAIGAILAEHHAVWDERGEIKRCVCGLLFGIQHPANGNHPTHLAEQLAKRTDEARAEADRLRVTLGAVTSELDNIVDNEGGEGVTHTEARIMHEVVTQIREAMKDAPDPVSLADVREDDES